MPKRVSQTTHNKQKTRYYRKHYRTANRCSRYKQWEIEMILVRAFPDVEIAKRLGRSLKAIHMKRTKLKAK